VLDDAFGLRWVRSFPNPDGVLVPGQFVKVVLTDDEPEARVVVPQSSVQENQSGPFVLALDAENRVSLRPIQTGQRIGTEVVVTEGLEPGETIIVDGIQKVRPGIRVSPTMARTQEQAVRGRP
ncbi:MAG: efflux RND transporter periplasmic adaptor subunit, partial [Hyphomicrobiaceae bacterium]